MFNEQGRESSSRQQCEPLRHRRLDEHARSPSAPWGPAASAGTPPNSKGRDQRVTLSRDGLTLIFGTMRAGGRGYTDLYMCSRLSMQDPWGPPVNCGKNVNSPGLESGPCLSPDGLALFFESCRDNDTPFVWNLWMSIRKRTRDPWGPAVKLPAPINTAYSDWNPAVSPDGRTLYFASDRPGGYGSDDLYSGSIVPVCDLNGDGKVDDKDILVLLDRWGQADSLCDIGPFPWGDGVVDIEDLKVFMVEWEKENPPAKP